MLWSGFSWFLWFGLSASLCINSYVCQCKIDLLLGEIDWARGKQVGEKFNLVSFDEYCIAVYGLKQTSFNLIRLIQVHRVGCGCFLFCSFRDTQSSMCQIISKLRATVLGKKSIFFFGLSDISWFSCIHLLFICLLCKILLSPLISWQFSVFKSLH